jgi:hypothetical protein
VSADHSRQKDAPRPARADLAAPSLAISVEPPARTLVWLATLAPSPNAQQASQIAEGEKGPLDQSARPTRPDRPVPTDPVPNDPARSIPRH